MELPIQLGVTCRLSLRPPLKGPQLSRPGFEGKAQQAAHQGSGCRNPLVIPWPSFSPHVAPWGPTEWPPELHSGRVDLVL